jgi:signal transduction histidine kinase
VLSRAIRVTDAVRPFAASAQSFPFSRARATRGQLLKRLAAVRPDRHCDVELRGTLQALRSLARRVQQLTLEERDLATQIEKLTHELAPHLLEQPGTGPLAAAQLLLSWSHPGRVAAKPRSRASPAAHRSQPRQARRSATGSTEAATASSTAHST